VENTSGKEYADTAAAAVLADFGSSEPAEPGGSYFYPGQKAALTRRENLEKGIPVVEEIWYDLLKELN